MTGICLSSRRTAAALLLVGLAACSRLEPVRLPAESALPPVGGGLWAELAAEREPPWYHLLNTPTEALTWRLRAIDAATESIDMETFLWKPDRSGRRVLQHLVAAAERGVRVRILLDDSFTMHEDLALHAVDEHPNIEYRIYNPVRERAGGAVARQMLNIGEFSRIDHRLHNKTLIVDGRLAIVGGRNLADEYFGEHESYNFRDLEVITLDGSVGEMREHFDRFWNSPWTFPIERIVERPPASRSLHELRRWLEEAPQLEFESGLPGERADWLALSRSAHAGTSRFVADHPARGAPGEAAEAPDEVAEALLELAAGARKELVLISAYLVPTPRLEHAVESAEARGVQVRILTNSLRSNNHLAAHSAYRNHLHRLVGHGADLHEVRAFAHDRHLHMRAPVDSKKLGLHAKALIVDDDRAYIGSCNLDPRSLRINTEVGLVIESEDLNRELREILAVDFHLRNAWAVRPAGEGRLVWVGDDRVLETMPADSIMQRLEDWFLSILPIEDEM